jgi:gliding motility-associated-like protein
MMKHLIVTIFLICSFFDNYGQLTCQDFTITGTTITASYPPSQGSSCTIAPTPIGSILWTGASATGSITYTFVTPQTNVSMWYTAVNTDDYGTISVNGGGVLSLSLLNGCANLSGNVVGPYTGDGSYGDIQVNVTSSLPFTTITLVNTGDNSGFNSGDCSSVSFSNIPVCDIQLGNDTTLCLGDALTLNATANNATYLWQDNSTNPTFNVSQQGTYWVQVTQDNCITSDTINVNFNPLPTVNVGNDTTLCQGDALTLNATTNNATYLWQNNTTSPTFNVSQQGTYWVQVTQNNCTTSDTINVNFNPLPTVNVGNDTTLCQGDTITLDAATNNATYLWQDNSVSSTFNVSEQGVYWVEVTQNNCTTSDTININFNPLPTVNVGIDTTLCLRDTITLDAATNNATYLWQDNSTSSTFNVSQQGTYWVQVTQNNCSLTDTILITEEECELILEIPNVFTPNNDGVNDVLVPKSNFGVISMNTTIYNRWGNKIYETDNLFIEWDGQFATDGTYFWVIDYSGLNGNKLSKKGQLALLR